MRFSDIIISMPLGYCSIESRSLTRRAPKKIIPEPGYTLTQFMREKIVATNVTLITTTREMLKRMLIQKMN